MATQIVDEFPSLMEAQIACGALRAAGFDAQVFDEGLGAAIPTGLLGDFRVVVPAADLVAAQSLLAAIKSKGPDDA